MGKRKVSKPAAKKRRKSTTQQKPTSSLAITGAALGRPGRKSLKTRRSGKKPGRSAVAAASVTPASLGTIRVAATGIQRNVPATQPQLMIMLPPRGLRATSSTLSAQTSAFMVSLHTAAQQLGRAAKTAGRGVLAAISRFWRRPPRIQNCRSSIQSPRMAPSWSKSMRGTWPTFEWLSRACGSPQCWRTSCHGCPECCDSRRSPQARPALPESTSRSHQLRAIRAAHVVAFTAAFGCNCHRRRGRSSEFMSTRNRAFGRSC